MIQKIDASSDMVHLHSALLASTLYLFKSIMHEQWNGNDLDLFLSFLPEVTSYDPKIRETGQMSHSGESRS